MLVIDAALRQVLTTMENTTMNHSRSSGMLTTPRSSEWLQVLHERQAHDGQAHD